MTDFELLTGIRPLSEDEADAKILQDFPWLVDQESASYASAREVLRELAAINGGVHGAPAGLLYAAAWIAQLRHE